jgi:hypothetical protein
MSDETRRMTVGEITLMREIALWRRSHGVDFYRERRIGRWVEWTDIANDRNVVCENTGESGFSHGTRYYIHDRVDVQSVTQAVDVLVALGYLPARFSSAYRAGWHASQVWYDPGVMERSDEFDRLFHDPLNVSFPAVSE